MKPRPPMLTKSDEVAISEGCYFDRGLAHRTVRWIEKKFAFHFYKWQRHILLLYFGWRRGDGGYRFTLVIIFIPKKNGKTTLIAPLVGFKLFELKQGRIYSAACAAKQAKVLMEQLLKIFEKAPAIAKKMIGRKATIKAFCNDFRRHVTNTKTGSRYEALAKNIKATDGMIPDFLVVDEIHVMDNAQVDVVMGGTSNNPDATTVIISTAGSGDKTHRSWQKYDWAKKVISGEIIDTTCLPIIHECPDDPQTADEIFDINRLLACNPRMREDPKALKSAIAEAEKARHERKYTWWLRYRLNKWLADDGVPYVDPDSEEYTKATVAMEDDELRAAPMCFAGLDRGQSWDFTALAMQFHLADERVYEVHYTFAPADCIKAMAEKDGIDYRQFIETGELELIPIGVVHDEWLTNRIREILQPFNVKALAADPYMAAFIMESLKIDGIDVFKITQSNNRLLTPVIDDYEIMIRQGRLLHRSNRLYDWQLRHCRKINASKDTFKLVKANTNSQGHGGLGHIDNVDAAINARAVARAHEVTNINYSSGAVVA